MRFPALLLLTATVAHAAPDVVVLSQTFTVGQNIPDFGDLLSTRSLSIGGGLLTDVSVGLNLTPAPGDNAFNGDFYAALGHDANSGYAVLLNRIGKISGDAFGSGDNGFSVIFSSASSTDIHTAPFDPDNPVTLTGTFAPDGRETSPSTVVDTDPRTATLGSFNGFSPDGQWRVFISDESVGGTGRLQNWTLGLTIAPDGVTALNVPSGATLAVALPQTLAAAFNNQGQVQAPTGAGQSVTFSGAVTGAGNYTGNLIFAGSFSPGNSPALVNITGDVTFTPTNELFIELGGFTRGTQYDALNISGLLTQSGTLNIALVGGFVPSAGNNFQLFAVIGGITGTFSNFDLPNLPGGLTWDTSQLSTSGLLGVVVVPEPATYATLFGLSALVLSLARRRRI